MNKGLNFTYFGPAAVLFIVTGIIVAGCISPNQGNPAPDTLTPAEARAIAKEATIYGFPMVDNYRIEYSYFVNATDPSHKPAWNRIESTARVYTPDDTTVQTPNSDTPYSMLGMDLRTEPLVLTVPPMDDGRYFSVQLIDAYTFNFAYFGSRTTGNDGGSFLIAGPDWQGPVPPGVKQVIRSETDLALAVYRTQLYNASDIDTVRKIQAGYTVQPLSTFLGSPAPAAAPAIHFIEPLTPQAERTDPAFFNELNFVLQFCQPTDPSEKDLVANFSRIGVGAGRNFDVTNLSPAMQTAVTQGMADAWVEYDHFKTTEIDTGKRTAADFFGTREYLNGNYLYRMAGAVLGIYGNSKEEALYPLYTVDAEGRALSGAGNYTLRFGPGQLPPVNAFWSLTMYKMPQSQLVANPINRYLINSPMLPQLETDADGGITLYIQHESPGADLESNWLPTPEGPFVMSMRLYWPKQEALNGTWKQPPLRRVS
jgi:hypothetical protein